MAVWIIVAIVLIVLFVRSIATSGPQKGGPGDSPTYAPGDSPTYRPGDSPTFLPGSAPQLQPPAPRKRQGAPAARRSRRDGRPEAVEVVVVEERSPRPERRELQERQERRSGYVGSTALDNSALSSTLITPYEPSSLLTTLSSTLHAFDAQGTDDVTSAG